jgi:hypothetical protein
MDTDDKLQAMPDAYNQPIGHADVQRIPYPLQYGKHLRSGGPFHRRQLAAHNRPHHFYRIQVAPVCRPSRQDPH